MEVILMRNSRMPFLNAALSPPDLNHGENCKDDLSGETNRFSRRSVRGNLIQSDRPSTAPNPISAYISTRNATNPIND